MGKLDNRLDKVTNGLGVIGDDFEVFFPTSKLENQIEYNINGNELVEHLN